MKKTLAGLLVLLAAGTASASPSDMAPRAAALDAQVAFWTSGFGDADLIAGTGCTAPSVPAVSTRNVEIRAVSRSIERWEACHNGFMQRLAATPAEARIPADVLAAMSADERVQALRHVEAVQARVTAEAFADAATRMARHGDWLARTVSAAAADHPALAASRLPMSDEQASTLFDVRSLRYEQRREPPRPRRF